MIRRIDHFPPRLLVLISVPAAPVSVWGRTADHSARQSGTSVAGLQALILLISHTLAQVVGIGVDHERAPHNRVIASQLDQLVLDLEFSNTARGLHVSQVANMAILVLRTGMGFVVLKCWNH